MKQIKIGNIEITNPILLAPMEGITDLPFRLICKEYGADIVYTEFAAAEALVRYVPQTLKKIRIDNMERPVAVQIFGSSPDRMAEAAHIVEESGADFIDINYGCWVKKVVNNNAGSALMKAPELMSEITNKCVNAVKVPVTIKTRLGWDFDSINIFKIAKMQEEAGATAITVHCRTRTQKITGNADWSYIPNIKENITIPLILNGDICSPELCLEAMNITGADGIMIGRAALGNPFLFKQGKEMISNNNYFQPTIKDKIDCCIRHLELNIEIKGEHGLLEFRKHYSGYLRGMFNAGEYRQKLVRTEKIDEIKNILYNYYNFLENSRKL
jgi:tRNA-dihydrouridine synthase B